MCLGIPGKLPPSGLTRQRPTHGPCGLWRCGQRSLLALETEARVNDYVLVHVGFAISRINEEEAQQTLALLAEMDSLAEELPQRVDF